MNSVLVKNEKEYTSVSHDLLSRNYTLQKEGILKGHRVTYFEKKIQKIQRLILFAVIFFASLFSCRLALRSERMKKWKKEAKTGKKVASIEQLYSKIDSDLRKNSVPDQSKKSPSIEETQPLTLSESPGNHKATEITKELLTPETVEPHQLETLAILSTEFQGNDEKEKLKSQTDELHKYENVKPEVLESVETAQELQDISEDVQEDKTIESESQQDVLAATPFPNPSRLAEIEQRLKFLFPSIGDWGREEDYTPLQKAARAGNLRECQRLLNEGSFVEEIGFCKIPPLFLATLSENIELCLLLFQKAQQNQQETFLCRIIRYCWREQAPHFLKYLKACTPNFSFIIAQYEAGEDEKALNFFKSLSSQDQATTLFDVFSFGHIKAFSQLYNAAPRCVRGCKINDNTFLSLAISWNHEPFIRIVLDEKEFEVVKVINDRRKTPFSLAKDTLDPALYSVLKNRDGGFSEELYKCQLLALYLELEQFSGLTVDQRKLLPKELAKSFREILSSKCGEVLANETYRLSLEILENATSDLETILSRHSENKVTLILHGWRGHHAASILYKHIFIKIDTAEPGAGVYYFEIGNNDPQVIREAIATLLHYYHYRIPEEEGYNYFHIVLNQKLSLRKKEGGYHMNQNGANSCGWKSLVCASMELFSLNEKIDTPIHEFICTLDKYYRNALKETLPIIKKYPEHIDLKKIYPQIIKTSLRERYSSCLEALLEFDPSLCNWQDEATGYSLLQLCYREKENGPFNLLKLFQILVNAGCSKDLIDKNGKSLAQYLAIPCENEKKEAFRLECLKLIR